MLQTDYSYRQVFSDNSPQLESLYVFTINFLRSEGCAIPDHDDSIRRGTAVYNNFHISSFGFWQQPLIARYVDALEAVHGSLKYGWMDANIHTMILSLLVPHTNLVVRTETRFGYRHNHHFALEGSLNHCHKVHSTFAVEPSEYE